MGKQYTKTTRKTRLSPDGFVAYEDVHIEMKLKRCPICGSSPTTMHFDEEDNSDLVSISCPKCGLRTDAIPDHEAAAQRWNRRRVVIAGVKKELRDCPFCGGKPEYEISDCGDNFSVYFVECTKCHARLKPYDDEQTARKIWNTRV